ncbi:hypothetical protein V1L52_04975 [Treponema sp. HNW]|uniref:hypothetical protein n=1 Tax=Treponema sp. HNW TaxID=3116654 RepID=UPI003D0EB70D
MILFGKKVEIYQSRNYAEFKTLKKLLKKNGITYGSSWVQTEVPCGCGAKINMRQVINRDYSPYIWYLYVRPENEERAKQLASEFLSGARGQRKMREKGA